eukprot:TRINITY_DN728_c0_g1_i1.p1 TRINITY_DN728_c0_g1~~TRINITY_DN728_c0_g1_i1.p1  ORF type:complete len:132 (-),score=30.38 TRINITY_DN728_c0_g1_i1:109-504(-)
MIPQLLNTVVPVIETTTEHSSFTIPFPREIFEDKAFTYPKGPHPIMARLQLEAQTLRDVKSLVIQLLSQLQVEENLLREELQTLMNRHPPVDDDSMCVDLLSTVGKMDYRMLDDTELDEFLEKEATEKGGT